MIKRYIHLNLLMAIRHNEYFYIWYLKNILLLILMYFDSS